MTKSAGETGLIFTGSPPSRFTVSLIAARSTRAGTPLKCKNKNSTVAIRHVCLNHVLNSDIISYVKSCNITRDGLNGISTPQD